MRYYSLFLISLGLLSCQKDSPTLEPLPPHEITLVYMVADNDLAPCTFRNCTRYH